MMTRPRFMSALALTLATLLAAPIHAAPVQVAPGAPVNYKMFPRLNATAGPGCTAQTVNWTNGGTSCSGTTAPTVNQATAVVTSANGNSGIGNFECDGSTNSYSFVAGGSTCTPPAPTACSAATVSWTVAGQTCSGAAGSTAVGSSTSVNSTNANSGSGNFSCGAGGTFNYVAAGSTCAAPPPANCTSQTVNWNQGGSACSVASGVRANGSTVTMNSTNGNNGAAQVTCNSVTNSYSVASGATCFPNACTSQTINWTVGGRSCSGATGSVTHNTARAVTSTNTNSGSATVTCNAQTNTFSAPTNLTCNAPAATACTSQTVNWTQGANTCSGSTGTVNNSASQSITTNTSGRIGSATVTCNAASNTYTVSGGTCSPNACTSQTINWSQGGNACTAPSGTTNNGVSKAISSTNTNQGSVTVACNSTTNTYTPSGATCAPPPPTSCAAGTVNWTVGGVTCSGTATQTNVGTSRTVSNATSGRTGSATFPCTTAGTFGSPTSATCANIPPANCAAGNVTWSASGNTCSGSRPAMNSGTSATVTNTAANRTGTASYSCANGTVTQTEGSCNAGGVVLNHGPNKISYAYSAACIIANNKNLYCWGTRGFTATSGGGSVTDNAPRLMGQNIDAVVADSGRRCALDTQGLLLCSGQGRQSSTNAGNTHGFLPATTPLANLTSIDPAHRYISIKSGTVDQFCGVTTTGLLRCMGFEFRTPTMITIDSGTRYVKLARGGFNICGQTTNGTWNCIRGITNTTNKSNWSHVIDRNVTVTAEQEDGVLNTLGSYFNLNQNGVANAVVQNGDGFFEFGRVPRFDGNSRYFSGTSGNTDPLGTQYQLLNGLNFIEAHSPLAFGGGGMWVGLRPNGDVVTFQFYAAHGMSHTESCGNNTCLRPHPTPRVILNINQ